jgi:hypothetical protein
MKLSRDKINDISHKVVAALRNHRAKHRGEGVAPVPAALRRYRGTREM